VKENFSRYGLLDEQTVFVKGFFADTLPKLKGNQFALLRLDGDMYESTICALDYLYPMLSPGGYIVIDDYGAVPACAEAVNNYRRNHGLSAPMQTIDWTGVWWRKEF
jgi:O-methyltransferase/8-demethyl-8-(2,3-dimethoxy-alpha-L-rhamnosyl)tetracenomycin-C 4'-O-methyltransferase